MPKKFKSFSEQANHLIVQKNVISDELIELVLKERSYISLINPYKKFFYTEVDSNNRHKYTKEVDIRNYIELSKYDDLISEELNKLIRNFERRLKLSLGYEISQLMNNLGDEICTSYIDIFKDINENPINITSIGFGEINEFYDKKTNKKYFENMDSSSVKYRTNLLLKIVNLNTESKNRLFKKYNVEDKLIPFWLVVHALTLGELYNLFEMLNYSLKANVITRVNTNIKNPKSRDMRRFSNILGRILGLRNTINHYEPLLEYINTIDQEEFIRTIKFLREINKLSTDLILPMFRESNFNNKDISETATTYKRLINTLGL